MEEYVCALALVAVMGLTYSRVARRRMPFVLRSVVVAGMFLTAVLACPPFLAHLRLRDRRRVAVLGHP